MIKETKNEKNKYKAPKKWDDRRGKKKKKEETRSYRFYKISQVYDLNVRVVRGYFCKFVFLYKITRKNRISAEIRFTRYIL